MESLFPDSVQFAQQASKVSASTAEFVVEFRALKCHESRLVDVTRDCTPLACVLDVIGGLAVWWHNNNQKTRFQGRGSP